MAAATSLKKEERQKGGEDGGEERGEGARDRGGCDEGTHGWLNPSLETPSRRQGAHTFPSFSL